MAMTVAPAEVAGEGHGHKTTARALATRRLIKVSKQKDSWSAELIADGRYYLDHDKFPVVRSSAKQPTRSSPRHSMSGAVPPVVDASSSPPERPARRLSRAEQLVADVVAADGSLQRPAKPCRRSAKVDACRWGTQRWPGLCACCTRSLLKLSVVVLR